MSAVRTRGFNGKLSMLADRVGELIEHWGFKKIHGRIWVYVFLSKRPIDATELQKHLKVSKALLSISIKELIKHGVIRVCGKSRQGTLLYSANQNLTDILRGVLQKRELKMLRAVTQSFGSLEREGAERDPSICTSQLAVLKEFISTAQITLEALLVLKTVQMDSWKEFGSATRSAPAPSELSQSPS
jgi:DNA-binding transcriptional regulator GbsR (MarR family)